MAMQYSTSGYPSALTLRSKRTLLVEGPDDKGVIARLIIELRNNKVMAADNVVVDTAQDLPDAPGGNRERVEAMHANVGGSSKFAALVDREFRNFDLQNGLDGAPHHVVVPENLFWTRGHSIENYLADMDDVIACLEQHYPEHLPQRYSQIIATAFPSILHSAASITLALEPINAAAQPSDRLNRVSSIKRLEPWRVLSDGSVAIDTGLFESILIDRGFTRASANAFSQRRAAFLSILQRRDLGISRWICHGHLMDSHLWSALGALLQHHGMESKHATQIAMGNKQALGRTSTDKWSAACVAGRGERPAALINWLCAG
jgi:hypothetical protein